MIPIVLLVLSAAGPNATVTVQGGTELAGALERIDSDSITLQIDGEEREIALSEVRRLSAVAEEAPPEAVRVRLVDGSVVTAGRVGASEEAGLVIAPSVGEPLAVPLEEIAWIRFGRSSPEVDPQWREMLRKPAARDALVIRRSGGVLDQVQGIVAGIAEESIAFDMDGQRIEAPRERLEGVIFASADREAAGTAICEISDTGGSRWRAASLEAVSPEGDEPAAVALVTSGGIRRRIPLAEISSLVPEGNVVRLGDLEPVVRRYSPYVGVPLPESLVSEQLGPRMTEDGSLRLVSRCRVEYRVPEGFKQFLADGRIAPEVSAGVSMRLRIAVDDTVAIDRVVPVDAPPAEIRVDVSDGRRLVIELDYEDGGDLGDVYLLREARFIP